MNIQTQTLAPSTSIKREDVPPPVIVYPNGKTEIFDPSAFSNYYLTLVIIHSAYDPHSTMSMQSFSKLKDDFDKENCKLLGISRDSPAVLKDWTSGNSDILFPIVSDMNLAETDYGLIQRLGITLVDGYATNSSIVVDKKGVIRYMDSVFGAGQSGEEMLRIVQALNRVIDSSSDEKLTPANWNTNDPFILNTRDGVKKYYFKKYPGESSENEEKGNSLISYFKSVFSVVEEDYYEAKEDSTNDNATFK